MTFFVVRLESRSPRGRTYCLISTSFKSGKANMNKDTRNAFPNGCGIEQCQLAAAEITERQLRPALNSEDVFRQRHACVRAGHGPNFTALTDDYQGLCRHHFEKCCVLWKKTKMRNRFNLEINFGHLARYCKISSIYIACVWLALACLCSSEADAQVHSKSSKNMLFKSVKLGQHFYRPLRFSDWTKRFNSKSSTRIKPPILRHFGTRPSETPPFNDQGQLRDNTNPTVAAHSALSLPDGEITGMWAVKLKFSRQNDSRELLDLSAETIAQQHGLENHGQIGELKGYYLFTRKEVSTTWTTMASAIVSSSSQEVESRKENGFSLFTTESNSVNVQSSVTTPNSVTDTMLTANQKITDTTVGLSASTYLSSSSPSTKQQQYKEPQFSTFSHIKEQRPGWNVEQGLSRHNQVEWQGHQVLLTRSKRGYIPLEMEKSDQIADSTTENPSSRAEISSSQFRQDYLKNNATRVPSMKIVYNSTVILKSKAIKIAPSSPNPEETREEKERHSFYFLFADIDSHIGTVTPQQAEVTRNQKYKDLVGGSSSGGGIGGRRMGIAIDDEESAGDWWQLEAESHEDGETSQSKTAAKFIDPLYGRQWHLENKAGTSEVGDCNVTEVWEHGITGKGVVVAVVDDGVQWDHPDLIENYCKEGSFDLNSNDDDPMPVRDSKEENKHGTRCAGEIAAAPNNHCGVGVAHGARFSGIRILDGPLTDSMEAAAFNKHLDVNDIYSCSWGPEDDGKTVDGPHPLAQAALRHGVVAGRRGFGSIYIVASGNGGHKGDNCNYDGYANSIYTITVGAVDEFGRVPSYAEECASMLACTFSSGAGAEDGNARKIVTTDWTLGKNKKKSSGCTESHTGTSAATPLAAGMVALMLEARPCLTWRDIQHIIVMTSIKIKPDSEEWTTNTAGYHHSDKRGFGLLNAWRMVNAARVWRPVPWLTSLTFECPDRRRVIPNTKKRALIVKTLVTEEQCKQSMVFTLEQVLVTVDIEHPRRGDLFISLVCPSGTTSIIGGPRKNDGSSNGLWNWTFATVKCWGEQPHGTYRMIIHDTQDRPKAMSGELRSWKLTLYGSTITQDDIDEQRTRVEEAMSGEHLKPYEAEEVTVSTDSPNDTVTTQKYQVGYCPPLAPNPYESLSLLEKSPTERTLKLLALSGCFLLLWGVYCSLDISSLRRRNAPGSLQSAHKDVKMPQIEMLQNTTSKQNRTVFREELLRSKLKTKTWMHEISSLFFENNHITKDSNGGEKDAKFEDLTEALPIKSEYTCSGN